MASGITKLGMASFVGILAIVGFIALSPKNESSNHQVAAVAYPETSSHPLSGHAPPKLDALPKGDVTAEQFGAVICLIPKQ